MFKKILKAKLGSLTNRELKEILDLATADIKVNRLAFGKRTSLIEAIVIAERCFSVLQKRKIA